MPTLHKKRGFFYGWVVLGTSFLVMAVIVGGVYYAFGIFLKPMITEFGWSRGMASIGYSIMSLVAGLGAPLYGAAIVRFGVKKVMLLGNTVLLIAILLLGVITQPWHLYLVWGVLCGVGIGSGAWLPAITLVNNWFIKKRALAIGIAHSGAGAGAIILAPTIGHLITVIGWRYAWFALAGIIFVFVLPPVLILARNRPEDIGQLPDGATESQIETEEAHPTVKRVYTTPIDWETRKAVRTSTLWLIAIIGGSNAFSLSMLATHQVAHLQDIGLSPLVATGALGLMVGASSVGRLVSGALGDRIEPRHIAVFACAMRAVGLLIFIQARELAWVYAYVVIYGVAMGALFVCIPALLGAYFGRKNFAAIHGMISAPTSLLGAAAPVFAGFAFDTFGSYLIPFSVATFLCVTAAICAFFAKPPKPPVLQAVA